ncbi:hypothetical protein LINGRAHAP2_LOCUS21948 [Linum grandiflorum]
MQHQWKVHPSHIYRKANNVADYFANFGHSFIYGLHIFDSPYQDLSHWLHYDFISVCCLNLLDFLIIFKGFRLPGFY